MTLIYQDFLRPEPAAKPAQTGTKLYKGDVVTAEALAGTLNSALPVQPVETITKYGQLPAMFVVTKLQQSQWNKAIYTMHYYCPQTGVRTYREVPKDTKLNILTGTKGKELRQDWNKAITEKLGTIGRRLVATLGTDPEIFVVDANNQVIPAWTYLPSKEKPLNFNLSAKAGTAYWDGFQAEFTTRGTDTCLSWVIDNVYAGLQTIHTAAQKVGGKLTIENVLPVDPDFLQNETQEHVQFGCAPSYNAYGLQGNIQDGRNVPFRFAGGHLHFGLTMTHEPTARQKMIETYVKALDKVLAVATVSMLGELDNPIRRKFYGLPGEYRMPNHGFEYRTLSNAWMCHPLAMNMVFDLGRSVCGLAEEGFIEAWNCSQDEMMEVVIENDITKAREIMDRNKSVFKQICKVITGPYYMQDRDLELAFSVWRNGIDTVVADPKNLIKNWNLDGTNGPWVGHSDGKGKCWNKSFPWIRTEKF